MKLLSSVITLTLMLTLIHTSACMILRQYQKPTTVLSFTKNMVNDPSCKNLAIDVSASCSTGLSAACTASKLFTTPCAGPLACGITSLIIFALLTLTIPDEESHKEEKKD